MKRLLKNVHGLDVLLGTVAVAASHWMATTCFDMYKHFYRHVAARGIEWNFPQTFQLMAALAVILSIRRVRFNHGEVRTALYALGGVLAMQLIGISIHEMVHTHSGGDLIPLLLACAIAIGVTAYLFKKSVEAYVTTISQYGWEAQDGLILFLSSACQTHTKPVAGDATTEVEIETPEWIAFKTELIEKVTERIDYDFVGNRHPLVGRNWIMPVLAVRASVMCRPVNSPPLEIAVIVSEDASALKANGTYRQFECFNAFIKGLCDRAGSEVVIEQVARCNFTDTTGIAAAVTAAKRHMHRKRIERFYLDVTGGTAICSSIATALMFGDGERIEYVDPAYQVRAYDLKLAQESFGE